MESGQQTFGAVQELLGREDVTVMLQTELDFFPVCVSM